MLTIRQGDLVQMQWHLGLCKPNQHHLAHKALARLGCDVFIPRHQAQRRWRGRMIQEVRPIFAGYIFFSMDPSRPVWHKVRSAQSISRIVTSGAQVPATVPAEVVSGLMTRCDANGLLQPYVEDFAVGDKIRIICGPFKDFVTSIEDIDPDRRLLVLLELLGRPTQVKLDPASATPDLSEQRPCERAGEYRRGLIKKETR